MYYKIYMKYAFIKYVYIFTFWIKVCRQLIM